jgi:hypothetical protein
MHFCQTMTDLEVSVVDSWRSSDKCNGCSSNGVLHTSSPRRLNFPSSHRMQIFLDVYLIRVH